MINSRKHLVQITPTTATIGTISKILIAEAKQDVTGTDPNDVQVGALVKAVWVEIWVLGIDNQPSSTTVNFHKKPPGAANMSYSNSIALHTYSGKNDVFYVTQGLVGDANTNPVPFFRGWIKVPKGKQRMALGDQLVVNISGISNGVEFCGVFIFKEYY